MILADTSVWIDHLRSGDPALAAQLDIAAVAIHPFVIGEIALENLRQRKLVLDSLRDLPAVAIATDEEVMAFIETHRLHGQGVGWVDVHLLASVRLTSDCRLWTRDRNLGAVASSLGLAVSPEA